MTLTAARSPSDDLDTNELLKPYVPRLVINWLRTTPDARHQALESSLLFVDISGFTALTERLARKGKIGAELMRDTLDGIFRALLDEAYDWGAGLLKWGGDALLLLFDGPIMSCAHAARRGRCSARSTGSGDFDSRTGPSSCGCRRGSVPARSTSS